MGELYIHLQHLGSHRAGVTGPKGFILQHLIQHDYLKKNSIYNDVVRNRL